MNNPGSSKPYVEKDFRVFEKKHQVAVNLDLGK
jgi:hypothetical protein